MFVSSSGNISNPNVQVDYAFDNTASFGITLSGSFTKGTVEIESNDPFTPQKVVLHDPLDDRDVDTLIWAVDFIRKFVKTPPFSNMIDTEIAPGNLSPSQLRQWIFDHCNGGNHHTGTCRLGDDNASVVDASLRVRNVNNLRIGDGSVLLNSGTGNPQMSIMAVGEMAADLILAKNITL